MVELIGGPGRMSGLILRIGQCLFAAASVGVMASASGFTIATAFYYLIPSMGLQALWSFGLACIDIHALRFNLDLYNHFVVSLFLVGDWVTATLSLAAASSSAGVMVLFARDTNFCSMMKERLSCGMFEVAIAFAFAAWFLLAASSYVTFCLVASI